MILLLFDCQITYIHNNFLGVVNEDSFPLHRNQFMSEFDG